MKENIEKQIKMYEELKEHKQIIANIDKDFFFNFAESLIKGYRELEERQQSYKIAYIQGKAFENHKWKSKIKEKIEWFEDTIPHLDNDGTEGDMKMLYEYAIEVLQELLEDK